ncbi:precorrin-2 dehydrogenase/sirohydrochlorin ferrochelatase family protein [Fulvivirga lutimaris]|uniref:precorrin-2 dehydrogenase/sirohydrochlorin ferrochelatase family protein n=1 Tax=Fulvivirga lutimaris TaxID=1819566 RepID=UPI0012BB4ECA|nr:bifunctional precorrin-2 dehydrogenase/sirohydrochlorin ferrochelatase [Fulvivirga lutimaris]MTI40755.1 bifunctional precorrin-2 dehydrogenase/sirohydrochlorin ferrochelatase [Fulvivirga lutimaris]
MQSPRNNLFPVFLKLSQLKVLIVGGGFVGQEKLEALLKNDPDARVKIVGREVSDSLIKLAESNSRIEWVVKPFGPTDIDSSIDMVIAATDSREVNLRVRNAAKAKRLLVNVADTPDLCDFYLGATVTKGQLKIGISTNGTSPTFAKRFRQVLEEILPEDTNDLLTNLKVIRDDLKGNFASKVTKLNELTSSLIK